MNGRSLFYKYKIIICFISRLYSFFPKRVNIFFYNHIKNGNLKIFLLLRYCILKNLCYCIGDNVYIGKNVDIEFFENISIGSNVSIHNYCYLNGYGNINIGNNVSIAHQCSLISFNHSYDSKDVPIKYNKLVGNEIVINDDVWIGARSCVLSNVTLNSRTIVAAGAIVSKSFEGNTIIGGVPAKIIKKI